MQQTHFKCELLTLKQIDTKLEPTYHLICESLKTNSMFLNYCSS
jgi:hypothetical protein